MRRSLACWLSVGVSCAVGSHAGELSIDAKDPRLVSHPALVARIAETPHGYFRFVSGAFAAETCRLFADAVATLPEVNLHGDAHVEQYAVTSIGRGLTDFDDCTRGKPVIDLVRFATSILLAARQKGWKDEQGPLLEFLRGYRDGLGGDMHLSMPTPKLVTRIRAEFKWEHAPALRRAHKLIDAAPLPIDAFADGVAQVEQLVRFSRELPACFFKVKRVGALSMGIGSALDEKYLIIFEGRTEAPDDDLVVEAKQIRDLEGNPCVRTDVGASRVLDGQRLIAYEPFAYAAVVPHGDRFFWVHDWTDEYVEASIRKEIQDPRDLRELAYDAGVQMGRAHPKRPDGAPDKERQHEAVRALDHIEARVRAAARQMAAETEAAWREFRQAVSAPTAPPR
jgi:hypothetical protein